MKQYFTTLHDYKVYLFYYYPPPHPSNKELEARLTKLGEMEGKNLLVNIVRLNDPNYTNIVGTFENKNLPTIVVTAIADLASLRAEGQYSTVYVRISNKRMLSSVDSIIECVKRFSLYLFLDKSMKS